jgi:SAM-dependent methyltransferase
MTAILHRLAQRWLEKRGYSVVSTRALTAFDKTGISQPVAPPPLAPEDEQVLRRDNPALAELHARYEALDVDAAVHGLWKPSFVSSQVSLAQFRAHSAYVWSYAELPRPTVLKYFIFAQDAARRTGTLFDRLDEDAAYGCLAYEFDGFGRVSRDRLDSALELSFVDRHTGLLGKPGLRVLDIGAGYGRLAYRTCAVADVADYACVDAIPESTFLCDYYLRRRGVADRARAVPLDAVAAAGSSLGRFDVAFNVHSWSECTLAAITWWVDLVRRLEVPYLFVVPNQHDRFLSREPDKTRRDFLPVITGAGYRQVAEEPLFEDPNVRQLLAIQDRLYLFRLDGAAG